MNDLLELVMDVSCCAGVRPQAEVTVVNGIWYSRYADVPIPRKTLPQFLMPVLDHAEGVAYVDGDSGAETTFKEVAEGARAAAGGFANLGVGPGDRVAILLPNCPEYSFLMLGLGLIGGIATTLNPAYTHDELSHALSLTTPKIAVTTEALLPGLRKAIDALQADVRVVLLGAPGTNAAAERELPIPMTTLLAPGLPFKESTDPDAVLVLPYSSGTTGLPKAVMLTHRNLVANISQMLVDPQDLVLYGPGTTFIAVLPFYHIYGMVVIMLLGMYVRAKTVVMAKFVPEKFVELLKVHKVTSAHVAPPIVNLLAKHPVVEKYLPLPDLKELLSGAAPLGGELAGQAASRLNCVVRQGYGMTELSPVSHYGQFKNANPSASGQLLPNLQLKLLDQDGNLISERYQEGAVCMRGPNVMKGYYKNDDATKDCIDSDNFLHTGDVGLIDDDGQMVIVDRVKELIKNKGFQIAPAELEAVLQAHPKVADAAVIGVAAGYSYGGQQGDGQVPKAFVVKKDASVTEEEIKQFIKDTLARHKWLGAVEFIDAIPKSPSGKILRKILRKSEEDKGMKVFG